MEFINQILPGITGEAAALGAAFFWAGATILYGVMGRFIPPLQMNLYKNAAASFMLAVTIFVSGIETAGAWGWPKQTDTQ